MGKVIKIIAGLGLVIAFFVGISKHRERLCQIPNFPFRNAIEYFFTPYDLYEGVFHEIIDVSEKGYEKDIPVKFKYVGSYEIGLELYDFDWDEQVWEISKPPLNLKLELDFYQDNKLVYSTTTSSDYHVVIRDPDNRALGLNIFFNVPKDVPHNADLVCKVTVLELGREFDELSGSVRLTIGRAVE